MAEVVLSDLRLILRSTLPEDTNDYSFEIVNDRFKKGDGFVGDIISVLVTNTKSQEKCYYVVKKNVPQENKVVNSSEMFENETHFYVTIWKKLSELYKSKRCTSLDFIPKCFGVSRSDVKTIVLEDLIAEGYVLYDRTKPFDDEHFTELFKVYGIFHGLSMVFKHKYFKEYSELLSPLHNMWKMWFKTYRGVRSDVQLNMKHAITYFDPSSENHVIEKLKAYEKSGVDLVSETFYQDKDAGLLLHGDGWSNNFMFKYDETGKLQNVKLLDFQLMSSGPPVHDLSYLFYTGGSAESFKQLHQYLKIYHANFSDILKDFGLDSDKLYPFESLKDEWKTKCKFGFTLGFMLWRIKLIDKNFVPDFSDYEFGELTEPVRIAENHKEVYKERSRDLILHMYENNFL